MFRPVLLRSIFRVIQTFVSIDFTLLRNKNDIVRWDGGIRDSRFEIRDAGCELREGYEGARRGEARQGARGEAGEDILCTFSHLIKQMNLVMLGET